MTVTPAPTLVERIFKSIRRFADSLLNDWIFGLTYSAGQFRNMARWTVFFLAWAVSVYILFTPDVWNSNFAGYYATLIKGLTEDRVLLLGLFVEFIFETILHPNVIGRMFALVAPYVLMYRLSALYLADIFEKEEEVARKFIRQAAFGVDYTTIHIRGGKIISEDEVSPIVQIGGPGYVELDLDSAALFEQPNGQVAVFGPSDKKKHVILDGFERIRQCVDLRDNAGSTSVTVRSRDGITVTAKDIQFTYSIYRGENAAKTLQIPFPFEKKAVESLVFGTTRVVKPGGKPSATPDWKTPLPSQQGGPISGEVGGFVSKRLLSDFFSNIGEPETPDAKPNEIARSALTGIFYDEGFKKRTAGRGIEIKWIGVGTWSMPQEITPAKHMEAWKLSRENFSKSNADAIGKLERESKQKEYYRILNEMIVNRFYYSYKREKSFDYIVNELLSAYWGILDDAMAILDQQNEFEADDGIYVTMETQIAVARKKLEKLVQKPAARPAESEYVSPSAQADQPVQGAETKSEEILLDELSSMVGDRDKAINLIRREVNNNPSLRGRAAIYSAIQRWQSGGFQ